MADEIKVSDLTQRFTAITPDELIMISEYQGTPGDYESKFVTKKEFLGYTEYSANLTQTGTSAPTANILCGDLGTVSFTRSGVGYYKCTATGLLTLTKVQVFFGTVMNINITAANKIVVDSASFTVDEFEFNTFNNVENVADAILAETPITIRVYL